MFTDHFDPDHITSLVLKSLSVTDSQVQTVLHKSRLSLHDLPTLLSPAALHYLETLAQRSHAITKQRFGNTMQLFTPLYVTNVCYNRCTYCGFSIDNDYERIILSDDDILKEAKHLSERGFDHLLLLTGEAPGKVDTPYIAHAVSLLKPYFSSIALEVQPLSTDNYKTLISSGADSITLYQETYHPDAYARYHLSGKKKHYGNRLNATDHAGEAQFYRIGMGALLGLYDWRFEALALAQHLCYMQQYYWRSKLSVSFNRIKDAVGDFKPAFNVPDTALVQLITSFRCLFPDLGITLSTREPKDIRNHLLKLGVTTLSAESKTVPGGYSCVTPNTEAQFDISDKRSLLEIQQELRRQGYEPVFKDWESSLTTA